MMRLGMVVARQGLGLDMPQTVVQNAQQLASEVERVDTDIQACAKSGGVDQQFVASWQTWRDNALGLAESVQKPSWPEALAGPVSLLLRQAFSSEALSTQLAALALWRKQAQQHGCTMTGPDVPKPPMDLADKFMWAGVGVGAVALAGVLLYGVITKQGPVMLIERLTSRKG